MYLFYSDDEKRRHYFENIQEQVANDTRIDQATTDPGDNALNSDIFKPGGDGYKGDSSYGDSMNDLFQDGDDHPDEVYVMEVMNTVPASLEPTDGGQLPSSDTSDSSANVLP